MPLSSSKPLLSMVVIASSCMISFAVDAQPQQCNHLTSAIDKTICTSPALTKMNNELEQEYTKLKKSQTPVDQVVTTNTQNHWHEQIKKQCTQQKYMEGCIQLNIQRQLYDIKHNATALVTVSKKWQRLNGSLREYANSIKNNTQQCSGITRRPPKNVTQLIPSQYVYAKSLVNTQCNTVIRTFVGCSTLKNNRCSNWQLKLVATDANNQHPYIVGTLATINRTGNSGAIFVPYKFSPNGKNVILKAMMRPAGAGGGSINYGYDVIIHNDKQQLSTTTQHYLAPANAHFYSNGTRVAYLENSPLLPNYPQPGGGSNKGKLVIKDVNTDEVLMTKEHTDTSYAIKNINTKNHTMTITTTRHRFGSKCPRTEDSLNCSTRTTSQEKIALP
ncbi:hypothetical protein VXS02_04910 [Photobacterium piscicola]|uniref:hypothetical protein n=1 Tax=Photobacterium piscicola TaxID=1378299 RepID=UPI002E18F50B|nr:hypothetical protein [Photobacterium piscicola]